MKPLYRNERTGEWIEGYNGAGYNTETGYVVTDAPPPWYVRHVRFVVPDGYAVIPGTRRTEMIDGLAYEVWDVETIGESIARREAEIEAQQNQAAIDEHNRLLALASIHNAAIAEIARLLAVFDLSIPCTEVEAEQRVYETCKQDVSKTADGVKLMRDYGKLMEHISGDDLVAIAAMLGGA